MKIKFLFLFLIISNVSIAQPGGGIDLEVCKKIVGTLIGAYEVDCNQLVADTITQTGTVSYETIPVKDPKGHILHYALGQADTIWHKPDCPTYKDSGRNWFNYNPSSGIYLSNDIHLIESTNTGNIPGTTKQEKTTVEIERQYICRVKKRIIEPFGHHFWNWIKEK